MMAPWRYYMFQDLAGNDAGQTWFPVLRQCLPHFGFNLRIIECQRDLPFYQIISSHKRPRVDMAESSG